MSKNPHSRKYELLYICLFIQNGNTKIEQFYEMILPRMAPRNLRKYFRMYTDTLNSIISYLALQEPFITLLDKYKARHAHKRLYTVLPKYSKIQVLPGITSCRLVKDNKQAIELNSLLINNMPEDGYEWN